MNNNRKIYIRVVIVGAAVAVAGIFMRRMGDPSLQHAGTLIGWIGIAIMIIARIVFGRRRA
jgi:ABC-type cobalamin transport system permease subunit